MPKTNVHRFVTVGASLLMAIALVAGIAVWGATSVRADDPAVMPKIVVTQEGDLSVVAISIVNSKQKNIRGVDVRATIPAGMTLAETDTFARVENGVLHWVVPNLGFSSSRSGFFFKVNPQGGSGNVTVSLAFNGEVNGTSSASTGVPGGMAVASKAPQAVLEIVPVTAKVADPNAIVATLPSTGAKIAFGQTGERVVSVGVPVTLGGESADKAGPARGFAWTLTGPSKSKAKLEATDQPTAKFTPDVVGTYKVDLVVRNELGASPMQSVQIRADTYIGVEEGGCVNCHPTETEEWAETGHAKIFKREIDGGADPAASHYGEGCLRCHTTGYYLGAANGGFAERQEQTGWKFPALESIQTGKGNFDAVPASLKAMSGIQCENCHGPARGHVEDKASMGSTLDEDTCNVCHDAGGHHVKGTMFTSAGHSDAAGQAWTYPVGPSRQDCVPCHSGSGFVSMTKNPTEKASWDNNPQIINCSGCHDPHSDANPRQLRVAGKVPWAPGAVAEKDFAQSAVCVSCHNVRNTGADAVKGSTPHYSSAAELMANTGGVDYGQNLPNSPHGLIVGASPMPNHAEPGTFLFGGKAPGSCVGCHMVPTIEDAKDPNYLKVGDHSFNVISPDGKFEYAEACQSCHAGIEEFNLKARADYDGNGKVEGVQNEVVGLLAVLKKAIATSGIRPMDAHPYFNRDDTAKATDKQRNAIYNFLFVRGAHGPDEGKAAAVHNFKRAVGLLQASYRDLTGNDVPGATLIK